MCDFAPCAPHVLLPRAMPHSALRARLAPVFRRLTMRPARLRRAAVPEDARVARPSRKPFSQFSAGSTSLPGRPPLPNVFLARRLWRRGALPCATLPLARRVCSRRALCHIVRFARVSIRSSASRRCGPRCSAVPPCPKMLVPRTQVANCACLFASRRRQRLVARPPAGAQRLSRPSPVASWGMPCATLPLACCLCSRCSPCHIARFAPVSLQYSGSRRRGPRCCAALSCPKLLLPRAQVANHSSDSPPATPRCPAARRRPTSCSPVARSVAGCCRAWGSPWRAACALAARHATYHASRASRSGLPVHDDAARIVAPCRHLR